MKKILFHVLLLVFIAFSCTEGDKSKNNKTTSDGFGEEVVMKMYPDSTKMITYRVHQQDSTRILRSYYHKNGKLYKQGVTLKGNKEGEWKAWNENGNLLTTGNYKNDLDHGYKIVYHKNGNKYYDGYFKNGVRVGKWKFYNQAGEYDKEIDYDKK